ncbi:PREDICTED: low-temperature-induced 65 kDa protein-like [Erythranthe guttata]|uniref:low-temperature-induced 65 kDa protein-like n=1 Tax=Erythranthe guttata TaxID=4155 RepID=UPI00064DC94D|nr:PREDICTED: low-temperature-induced 65 kDa protein-like [Erythranthe guttata]|eukprot:XP_012858053.1 PREDICTED: low-temperature-induced 65 kDa protein-like [Erythranthe guttata]
MVEEDARQLTSEQHHHKSVLKKVKEKAKKIKNTIKKHGHIGHEHDDDDDDDDDEETVNDHEVHGAPIYESTVVRSVNLPKESHTNLESHINLEKPTDTREDRYDDDDDNQRNKGTNKPFAPGRPQTDLPELQSGINPNAGMPKTKIEHLTGLEEDPNSPENSPSDNITPSNYQSKVAHPARSGSKEAEVAPLVSRFDTLNVGGESKTEPEQRSSYTWSHDQFAPQPTPTKTQFINPESANLKKDQDPSTIAGKISATTSAIADKALSAKNAVASKLGYGGGAAEAGNKPVSASATEYAHMVAEKLTPAYEKVAGAGNAVMSKVVGGGGGDAVGVPAKGGGSIGEYLAEKLRPGDEDKALSEAITGAFKGEGRPAAGKVTVSKEVADRLGPVEESKREGEDAVAAGLESSGQGMVDRLRDAVGVWLGKSAGMQTAQDSVSSSYGQVSCFFNFSIN